MMLPGRHPTLSSSQFSRCDMIASVDIYEWCPVSGISGGGGAHHSVPVSPAERGRGGPGPGQDRPCECRGGSRARAVRVIARLCRDEASKYWVRRWRDTPFSPASDFNQEKTMERWKCEVRKKSQWRVNSGPVPGENLVILRAVTSEIFANLLSPKSQDSGSCWCIAGWAVAVLLSLCVSTQLFPANHPHPPA